MSGRKADQIWSMSFKRLTLFIIFIFLTTFSFSQVNTSDRYYEIQTKKVIRIGMTDNYPPFSYVEKGKRDGFEVYLALKLAKFLGAKPKFHELGVNKGLNAIAVNEIDIIVSGLSRDAKRGKKIWFSVPYLEMTPGVIVDKRSLPQTQYGDDFEDTPFVSIWDIKRLSEFTFIIKKGTVYEQLVKEKFKNKNYIMVNSHEEAFEKLFDGSANGYVHDSLFLEYKLKKNKNWLSKVKLLKGGHQIEKICIGLPFGSYVLKNQIDLFLLETSRKGEIRQWFRKYFDK